MEIDARVEVQKGIEASGNSGTTHPTAGTTSSIMIRKISVTPSDNATNNTTHTTPTSTPTLQSISLHFDQTTDNEPKSPLSGHTTEERLANSILSIRMTPTIAFVLRNNPTTSTPYIQNNLFDCEEGDDKREPPEENLFPTKPTKKKKKMMTKKIIPWSPTPKPKKKKPKKLVPARPTH
jgi:hypothetical protein